MLEGYDPQRLLAMTDRERRWFDNVKKAFHESDQAFQRGRPEDHCLEELFKAIDTAKTLRRSLRGEDLSFSDNKKRFVEFLRLEIPAARPGGFEIALLKQETGALQKFDLGDILYAIRCKIHENENLNAAEKVDYHILINWSNQHSSVFAEVRDGTIVCNGHLIWNRLREVLSKFITCFESMIAFSNNETSFSVTCRPALGSIVPERIARK